MVLFNVSVKFYKFQLLKFKFFSRILLQQIFFSHDFIMKSIFSINRKLFLDIEYVMFKCRIFIQTLIFLKLDQCLSLVLK